MDDGYKKDQIILVNEGDWSDYGTKMVIRALKDFTETEVETTIPRGNDSRGRNQNTMELETWLIVGGFAEEVDYRVMDL